MDDWTRVAIRLRETLLAAGLKLDPARAKDAASILRFPGSVHWGETERTGDEVRGALLGGGRVGERVTPEDFIEALLSSEVQPSQDRPSHQPVRESAPTRIAGFEIPAGAISKSNARAAQGTKLPPPPETDYNVRMVVEMLTSRGSDLSYEEWRNVIWAVKDTGWDCAYELLEEWCRLSDTDWGKPWEDELRKVWESDDGSNASRITCASLVSWAREESGEEALRFLSERESQIEADGGQVVTVKSGRHTSTLLIPKLPKPYFRKDDEPGLWCRIPVAGSEEVNAKTGEAEATEWEDFKFLDIDVFVTDRVQEISGSGKSDLFPVTIVTPHDGIRLERIPANMLTTPAEARKCLSGFSVFPNGPLGAQIMTNYLTAQAKEIIQNRKATSRKTHMGWSGGKWSEAEFIVGEYAYRPDGTTTPVVYEGEAEGLSEATKPQGDLEVWKDIVRLYNDAAYAPGQALLLLSMGAPLYRFTGKAGGVANLHTSKSGYGKSKMLQVAVSVWSAITPTSKGPCLFIGDATPNSLELVMGTANSLPVAADEITNKMNPQENRQRAAALRDFIYTSTIGQTKLRANGSSDTTRRQRTWETYLLTTANAPLESLFSTTRSADAERARSLDLDGNSMPLYEDFKSISIEELARRRRLLDEALAQNYGLAGRELIEAYTSRLPEFIDRMQAVYTKYEYEASQRDRFIVAMIASARVGWETGTELGLISFAWEPVEKVLLDALRQQTLAREEDATSDPSTLLNEYIRQFGAQIAMVKHTGGKPYPYGMRAPRDPLIGRYEVDRNRLFLARSDLKNFILDQRVQPSMIDRYLIDCGALINKGSKVSLGRGHGISGQPYSIEIDPIKAGIIPPEEEEHSAPESDE